MDIINLIKTFTTYEELLEEIKKTSIKHNESGNLVTLYTPFVEETYSLSSAERECRSIVIDKRSLNIVAYSQPKVLYNDYLVIADSEINKCKRIITDCYEGTLLMMYNYEDVWYLSTRKYADANDSFWRSNKSHTQLFKECVGNWEQFCNLHDKSKIYLYVLVHHENSSLIDYSDTLGEGYKRFILVLVRDRVTLEPTFCYDFDGNLTPWENLYVQPKTEEYASGVLQVKFYDNYDCLDRFNDNEEEVKKVTDIRHEGIIVVVMNEKNKEMHVKLQTNSYKIYSESTCQKFIPRSSAYYIKLYQENKLDLYFGKFTDEILYKCSDNNSYQVKGLIDCLFKVLTSEVLFMFKLLWDIRSGVQKEENSDIYYTLTFEYKKVFYQLRGIYFSKKVKDSLNKYITIKTVYELLKSYDPSKFAVLIKDRKDLLEKSPKLKSLLIEYHKNDFISKNIRYIGLAEEFIFHTEK